MIEGKSLFIWYIDQIEGGNVSAIAEKAQLAGYQELVIKCIDGKVEINAPKLPALIAACTPKGIKISLWGYFYGVSTNNAIAEANAAAAIINKYKNSFGIDVFLIDVESEYKADGSKAWATNFMNTLTALINPLIWLGLCSYRYPSAHPELPWLEFLNKCDFHAPQVYWEQSSNPAFQLQKSYDELTALKPLPYYPFGSAYCNGDWCATPAQVIEFADKAMSLKLPGAGYWAWHSAVGIAGMWSALAGITYVISPPDPPVEPPPAPVTPTLLQAHVLATSLPFVNVRKSPKVGATILTTISPNKNILITQIRPKAGGAQWVGVIVPNGGDGTNDVSGFAAFTYSDKDLLGWGWV